MTSRILHVIVKELCNILDISMNMLVFDPTGAMSHDFMRVSQYFAIHAKLYKRREAVVRLGRT